MIKNLTLRPVTMDDAPALHELCWPEMIITEVEMRVRAALGIPKDGDRAWGYVALVEDQTVGFGQLTRWGTRGEICNLIVAEAWRSQGIGTTIINRLVGIAREFGMRDVEIGVAQSNPSALALYRRLGFRDERRMILDVGNGPEPVVYLVLDLGRGICEA